MIGYELELSEAEKEKITRDFLPFIKYTAYRFSWRIPPELTVEDLVSIGIVGLLDALRRYREGEAKLNTFVEYRIKGAMLDELRNHMNLSKSARKKVSEVKKAQSTLERNLGRPPEDEEVAGSLDISLEEYYRILHEGQAAITLRFEDFGDRLHDDEGIDVTECLPDPDAKSPLQILEDTDRKEILSGYIDKLPEKEKIVLSLYYWEELTMKEIGKVLRLSEGRVCQLHTQALTRLKAKLESPV